MGINVTTTEGKRTLPFASEISKQMNTKLLSYAPLSGATFSGEIQIPQRTKSFSLTDLRATFPATEAQVGDAVKFVQLDISNKYSKKDHGHAVATQSAAGFLSANDKKKLDSMTGNVTGVKGAQDAAYKTGNVNITPLSVGAVSMTSYFCVTSSVNKYAKIFTSGKLTSAWDSISMIFIVTDKNSSNDIAYTAGYYLYYRGVGTNNSVFSIRRLFGESQMSGLLYADYVSAPFSADSNYFELYYKPSYKGDSSKSFQILSYFKRTGASSLTDYTQFSGNLAGVDSVSSIGQLINFASTEVVTYLPYTGGTVTGSLILSKITDAAGAADNSPALIIGNKAGQHLEFDDNELMSKTGPTGVGVLVLNGDGGLVRTGAGGFQSNGNIVSEKAAPWIVGVDTSRTYATEPDSDKFAGFEIRGSGTGTTWMSSFRNKQTSTGNLTELGVRGKDGSSKFLSFVANSGNGSVYFCPSANAAYDLGSPTNKWKNVYASSFNGGVVASGGLRLPTGSMTALDTADSTANYFITMKNWNTANANDGQLYYLNAGNAKSVIGLGNVDNISDANQVKHGITALGNVNLNNYNALSYVGWYRATGGNTIANKPHLVDSFFMHVYMVGVNTVCQELVDSTQKITWKRSYDTVGKTWSPWHQDISAKLVTTTANDYGNFYSIKGSGPYDTKYFDMVYMFSDRAGATTGNGMEVIYQGSGNTYLSSGESGFNLRAYYYAHKTSTGTNTTTDTTKDKSYQFVNGDENWSNDNEKLYLTSDGDIFLISNCQNTNANTAVASAVHKRLRFAANGTLQPVADLEWSLGTSSRRFNNIYGNVITGVSFNATSDRNLKTNIKDFTSDGRSILDVPVRTFTWKDSKEDSIGFIAQELEEVYPELVTTSSEGIKSIKETKFIYYLIDELKKLKQEVAELKSKR